MEAVLADLLTGIHLGIVLYVIVGQALILLGWAFGWRWVRNAWFRASHLFVIAWVAVQGVLGEICPLTIWEFELRRKAGQEGQEGTFIGRLLHDLLFVDASQVLLDWIYVAFALLVLVTFVFCPPRRKRRPASPATSA